MKKTLKGNLSIEAAVIIPVILLIFSILMNILFYYHDKNVIAGAAHETVVYGSSHSEKTEVELEIYYQKCVSGKLLLFTGTIGQINLEKNKVEITCTARKKMMFLRMERQAVITHPEQYIRNIRKLEKIGESVGGSD